MQGEPRESGATPDSSAAPTAPLPFNVQTHFAWIRTSLSAERTLMAWNRTSLSLIGFGFTIYQFFQKFQEATVGPNAAHPEAPRLLGLALITVGTLGTLIALLQYWQIKMYLKGDEFKPNGLREGMPGWSLTLFVATFSAVIGVVTLGWMLLRG
jgi:putative membrane protein